MQKNERRTRLDWVRNRVSRSIESEERTASRSYLQETDNCSPGGSHHIQTDAIGRSIVREYHLGTGEEVD